MNASTPERWERIKQLFDESLRLPPEQRAAFINQQCQEDLALAEEVLDLLSHHDYGGNDAGFTADGIPALTGLPTESTTTAERAPLPERIGDYRVVRLLGEGGMGDRLPGRA
jgi:serine/threonine-protein kinase